jgi:hypothetical protein
MKLDRTAFRAGTYQELDHNYDFWSQKSMAERLIAANYLNSVAFNFDIDNPPRMDKTVFSMRKHEK